MQYGLISELDGKTLEKTIDLICQEFYLDESINTCEIGIFDGQTSRGIHEYIKSKKYGKGVLSGDHGYATVQYYNHNHTCIDNNKDKEVLKPFPECNLIIGNSTEVYNQLKDNSQHLILIDANHAFPYVVSDFFCYKNKVKRGGFICFHDTSPQAQGQDWQRVGSEQDEDMYISVYKALQEMGMFNDVGYDLYPNGTVSPRYKGNFGFRLIFEDYDPNDKAGGIMCFQKRK